METFNPLKAHNRRSRSRVNTLTEMVIIECDACGLFKKMKPGTKVCDTCEVNGQDYSGYMDD